MRYSISDCGVMAVYGREELVAALARSEAPVTLITGDSGVGKSSVLTAVQHASEDALAPSPLTIAYSGGALQQALLRGLADAVSVYVTAHGRAREIARCIVEMADRLALEGAQELAKVIGKELLALVRGRIGDDVGRAFAEYLRELKSTIDERLAVRLTAAVDPGVAGLVLDFATEVCAFVGDQRVLLGFDAGERLGDEDIRLLADLADRLPDQLRLRVAFSTHTDRHRGQVEFLLGSGRNISEQQILGLDAKSIATWFLDEGLDPGAAIDVVRVTGGYPLHVGDLVAHLKQGGSIEDAPLSELFARRTNEAWQSLLPDIARHARALCVFADPLPRERLLSFLGLDGPLWGEVEDRLWRTRVFSVEVNAQRWFHEQRRRYLLREVLSDAERAEASVRATNQLYDLVVHDGAVERLGELGTVVAAAVPLLQADDQLATVVELGRDELALAASLIELVEPSSTTPAVDGDVLLEYAHSVFGAAGDLIEALRRLGQRNLAVVQENSGVAVAVPYWRSELAIATVGGRAVRELGRMPVPQAASAVFELQVRPRLGPFSKIQYGLGHPSMGKLSEMAMDLRRPSPPPLVVGRPDPGSNLLIRGNHAGRGFYAAVTFSSTSDRDRARERLEGLNGEIFGERFEVNDVLTHPVDPVPSRRFLEAAERLTGKSLGTALPSRMISLSLEQPVPAVEGLSRKAAVLQTVRERSTKLEQIATQLDEPLGYAYVSEAGAFWKIEIQGGREGVEEVQGQANLRWDDPYTIFRLTQLLNLRQAESITHLSARSGRVFDYNDPVVELLAHLHWKAVQFNRHQSRRRNIVLDADSLEDMLTKAMQRNLEDARALASSAPVGSEIHLREPHITHLLVEVDRSQLGLRPGAYSTATSVFIPNPGGQEEVRVTVVYRIHPLDRTNRGDDRTASRAWLQQIGLRGELYDHHYGAGDLSVVLAHMLGHTTDELQLVLPSRS